MAVIAEKRRQDVDMEKILKALEALEVLDLHALADADVGEGTIHHIFTVYYPSRSFVYFTYPSHP